MSQFLEEIFSRWWGCLIDFSRTSSSAAYHTCSNRIQRVAVCNGVEDQHADSVERLSRVSDSYF